MRRTLHILLFVFCVWSADGGLYAQSNFTVAIDKINYMYKSPPRPDGLFTITFTPGSQRAYLSIGATNNSTQQFGIIVSNMLLPSSSDAPGPVTLSTTFDFSKISAAPYLVPLLLTVYIHILTSPGFYPFEPTTWKDTKNVSVNQTTDDAKGSQTSAVTSVPIATVVRRGQTVGDPLSEYQYRPDAPNLDLDNSQNGITATYAGDLNACVPTATANSMKWAQSKYSDINLPADMDLRKTEATLSGLMKRENGEGTYTDKMITGKLDFIEQFNLPMEVKYQAFGLANPVGVGSTSGKSLGRSFNPKTNEPKPTWDFLKKMMKNGEDVEINFTWYDSVAKKWYAHSVNVTGVNEFQSGVKRIAFKHDRRQSFSGGLKEEIHDINIDAAGWMRFGEHNENFIKDVIVESPVIQEGRETAAWLNELFTDAPLRKVSSGILVTRFVEVALKSTVADLSNYTVTLYDGKTGASYASYTLDKFTAGSAGNGLTPYVMDIQGLLGPPAGIAISYRGAVIQRQFISYGGTFVAADGDATGLTSTNIGNIPTSASLQMTGSGTSYSQFSVHYGVPTPGGINQDETYSATGLAKPNSISPNTGERNKTGPATLTWSKVVGASAYELHVSTDPFFLTAALVNNSALTDTNYSFANTNLEGSKLYWRVRALGTNVKSGFSATRDFSNKLTSPTNLSAALVQLKVALSWQNNSSRSKGFYVQRKAGDLNSSNPFQTIDSVTTNSYADANVQPGATYTYRVYAYNDFAESDFSNTQTLSLVIVLQAPVLFAPADSAKNMPLSLSLSWNTVAGATAYHLQMFNRSDLTSALLDDSTLTVNLRAIGPLALATTYYWRVRVKTDGGWSPFSQVRRFSTIQTTDVEQLGGALPEAYSLSQNYPNPFNPSTTITFALPKAGHVVLTVVDALGRVQAVLVNGERPAGAYTASWNAANVPSGIYFYRLSVVPSAQWDIVPAEGQDGQAGAYVETKKMVLVR